MKKRLTGITWNHTRGFLPMVATAQRFHETHPDVEIHWEKRALQAFADTPIQTLAKNFDLLVIDHPFAGYAAAHPVLLPLDEHLPADFLADQARNSVGSSHSSYAYDGHQWALAIDAAAPVAAWRPDLIKKPPGGWEEVIEWARQGRVAVPGVALDTLMDWFMLCLEAGAEPFNQAIPPTTTSAPPHWKAIASSALNKLRTLFQLCAPACFSRNPILTYEAMCAGDDLWYCPFAYGYSNYAREGYARSRLQFGNPVDGLHTTLGGTGLAISRNSRHRSTATAYAQYVASANCQATLYWESGGQPGHRTAWLDPAANRATHDYFRATLPALDRAYLRPRYNGYPKFQDAAAPLVQSYLQHGGPLHPVLRQLWDLHRSSWKGLPIKS